MREKRRVDVKYLTSSQSKIILFVTGELDSMWSETGWLRPLLNFGKVAGIEHLRLWRDSGCEARRRTQKNQGEARSRYPGRESRPRATTGQPLCIGGSARQLQRCIRCSLWNAGFNASRPILPKVHFLGTWTQHPCDKFTLIVSYSSSDGCTEKKKWE